MNRKSIIDMLVVVGTILGSMVLLYLLMLFFTNFNS